MPIVGCFFRPGGKLGGVIRLEHARFSYASPHIIFPPKLRMRIWPPIHPGKANPPLPSFPTTEKTTGGGSASLFNLVAAQTAHVRAAHFCRVFIQLLANVVARARQRAENGALFDRNVVGGVGGGEK